MDDYKHISMCSAIEGDVAEIGLGEGLSADWAMSNPKCKSLDSFEIDPQAVIDFNTRKPDKDRRHTVIESDFLTHSGRKYDFIYIDTMYNTPETRDNTIAIATKAKTRLRAGGKIAIEFWGDCVEERDLRAWLKANFTPTLERVVKTRTKGMRSHIMYWEPK